MRSICATLRPSSAATTASAWMLRTRIGWRVQALSPVHPSTSVSDWSMARRRSLTSDSGLKSGLSALVGAPWRATMRPTTLLPIAPCSDRSPADDRPRPSRAVRPAASRRSSPGGSARPGPRGARRRGARPHPVP